MQYRQTRQTFLTWRELAVRAARELLARDRHHDLARAALLLAAVVELAEGWGVRGHLEDACRKAGAPCPRELARRVTRKQARWLRARGLAVPATRGEACAVIGGAL